MQLNSTEISELIKQRIAQFMSICRWHLKNTDFLKTQLRYN